MGDWTEHAACRQLDPDVSDEIFFPNGLTSMSDVERAAAAAPARHICNTCPVINTCLAYVTELEAGTGMHSRYGIWAALTPKERMRQDPTIQARRRKRKA